MSSKTDAILPGSARASRAVSGASPETCEDVQYARRRLPHFERAWSKYAVTFTTHLRHHLRSDERDVVLRSILFAHESEQYELFAACVMPDHVHLLFEPQIKDHDETAAAVFWSLPEILQGIKSASAHRINKLRGASGPVWEKESFDRLIRSETDLQEKFRYICRNPWETGLIRNGERYGWLWTRENSSAGAPKRAREARALPGASACASSDAGGIVWTKEAR